MEDTPVKNNKSTSLILGHTLLLLIGLAGLLGSILYLKLFGVTLITGVISIWLIYRAVRFLKK